MPNITLTYHRCNRCGVPQLKATVLCPKCSQKWEQEATGKPIIKKK